MSEENVELVRRVYEAIDRGDPTAVLALYDPDVVWDFTRSPFRNVFNRQTYVGRQGLRDFTRERFEDWETMEDDLLDLIDVGDHVVSVVTTKGRGKASGAEVGKTHAGIWTIRQGMITGVEWMSREEAFEVAGLSE